MATKSAPNIEDQLHGPKYGYLYHTVPYGSIWDVIYILIYTHIHNIYIYTHIIYIHNIYNMSDTSKNGLRLPILSNIIPTFCAQIRRFHA